MSDFAGMEDLLQDFLQEAGDLLSDVDNKLVDLERSPDDSRLLNDIFRGFHTIKGGAGFLNAGELVKLCHLTENLFDKLRNGEMTLTPELDGYHHGGDAGCSQHVWRDRAGEAARPGARRSEPICARLAGPVAGRLNWRPAATGGVDGER
jgi:HPt (histidine-containing phosphotransfer) domain-containing protein